MISRLTPMVLQRLSSLTETGVDPAMALLPPQLDTSLARVMLYAITLQEAAAVHRVQLGGPARGLWQFERAGGVNGVMNHDATRKMALDLCAERGVLFQSQAIYDRLAIDDALAAGFARLLLYTDPQRLPGLSEPLAAWGYYLRTWRPGKPHADAWALYHAAAVEFELGRVP
jgi:hypothetical protein